MFVKVVLLVSFSAYNFSFKDFPYFAQKSIKFGYLLDLVSSGSVILLKIILE